MAENADVLIQVGALPDVASAKEAGRKIREIIEAEVSKFAGSTLKGQKGIKGVISAISGLSGTTGVDTYYKAAESRYALRNVSRKGLTATQRAELREMDRELGIIENVARRSSINEPINRTFAETRLRSKIDTSLQTLNKGLTPNFAEVYRAAERSGDTKKLAALDRQIAIKTKAAGVVLSNPEDVTNEQFGAAAATKKVVSELKSNTKALTGLTKVASIVGTEFIRTATAVIPTYWEQHVARSYWGTREAEVARVGAVAKGAGGAVGALIGGAIGSVVPGIGTVIGAGIGGALGESVGGLYGTYQSKQLEATKKTINQVNQRYRMAGIYGDQYSVGYASAVQDTDMASAGDVEKMVHNSATLGARMMFGQVGENEMLMYSLMPRYFAAAMNGASAEELAQIFKEDLDKLPPMFRVWAAENVGGGSLGMMAYSNSPMFSGVQGGAAKFREYDTEQMQLGAGFAVQTATRAIENRREEQKAFRTDLERNMRSPRAGTWMPTGTEEERVFYRRAPMMRAQAVIDEYTGKSDNRMVPDMSSAIGAKSILQTINIVLPDGTLVEQYENEIKKDFMESGYTSTVGIE